MQFFSTILGVDDDLILYKDSNLHLSTLAQTYQLLHQLPNTRVAFPEVLGVLKYTLSL